MISVSDMPINRKLTWIILMTCSTVLLMVGIATIVTVESALRRSMVEEMTVLSDLLGRYSTAALSFHREEDIEEVQKILSAVGANSHIIAARLYDKDRQPFGEYVRDHETPDFPQQPPPLGHQFTTDYLEISHSVDFEQKNIGTIYLRADLGRIYSQRNLHMGIVSLVLIAAILMTFAISSWLRRPITEPILALTGVARQIAEKKDYSIRATKHSKNEIGLLTDAFNQMLREIESGQRSLQKAYQTVQEEMVVRKQAEQKIYQLNNELEQRVKERTSDLEKANKELEAFSYTISHDLRAPLRSVDGFSKIVEEDCSPQLTEDGKRYLKMIRQGAQQMAALIDDLLDFSRLSRSPLDKRSIDMNSLVSGVWENLRPLRTNRQVELKMGELPPCQGDPALLKQVWMNLLSNALKYSRNRPIARIEIGTGGMDGKSNYFVRDNGTGFDMKYSHKLFGVFQRLHRAEDYEGTGVGLAIVQRIVQRHGGRIWTESVLDQGATFYFTL